MARRVKRRAQAIALPCQTTIPKLYFLPPGGPATMAMNFKDMSGGRVQVNVIPGADRWPVQQLLPLFIRFTIAHLLGQQ